MAIYNAPESLHVGTGTETVFGFNWPYLLPRDLIVTMNGLPVPTVLASPNQVAITPAPAAGVIVRIFRNTPAQNPTYLFATGIPMLPKYIDGNNKQLLYALHEGLLQFSQTQATADEALRRAAAAEVSAAAAQASAAQQAANIRRTLRVAGTDPELPVLPSVAARASKVLGFDANGNPVGVVPVSGSGTELALDLASPIPGRGAAMVAYTYGAAHSEARDVDDKLRETRSILDFVPQNQRSAIRNGTSTWDAGEVINYALRESPGRILVPAGARLSTGRPVDLQRGSWLAGDAPFDTRPGYGCKIALLDGSNCELLRTPYAVDGTTQTHFMGISDILFEGNKAGQTAEVSGGVIKFWGAFVGSWLDRVFIKDTLGTSLDFRGGSDVAVSHLWIGGCATATGYALDTNAELTGSITGGLLQFDNLYVENTSIDKNFDAKANEAYRGKNVRLRRLVSAHIKEIHTEGAAVAIDLDRNHTVRIGKITGFNIGSTSESESSLVRHIGGMSRAVSIGTMQYASAVNGAYMVRKSAALASNNAVPEVKNIPIPFVTGYTSAADNLQSYEKAARTSYANMLGVEKIAAYPEVTVNLFWGDADDSTTTRSRFKERGLGPVISSSISQPGNTEKDFISVRSSGGSGDSITVSDPLKLGSRSTAANVGAGMIYFGSALPGVGTGPVFQRVAGLASGADALATVIRSNGPPTGGATFFGQFLVDETTPVPKKVYMATSIAGSVSDWSPLN